jgi:oxygen-dependent protoporphyrinogen oxidase
MSRRHVLVIGAGITGLAAAHRLRELDDTLQVTLLEGSDRVGGVIGTIRRDGFLIETGPDNFITTKTEALDLVKRLGLEDQILPTAETNRGAMVVRDGKLHPIPEGFTMMAPTRLGPILRTRILSWRAKCRMAFEPWVAARGGEDESLASFITRRFGREAFERLVEPLVAGIYSADAKTLSVAATFPKFLAMETEHGSLIKGMRRTVGKGSTDRGARYSMFITLQDGMDVLTDALMSRIGPDTIQTSCAVESIERANGGWQVQCVGGRTLEADGVIVATSTTVASQITASFDSGLADALSKISYKSSVVVSMGVRRDQIQHKLNAFGFVVPRVEGRRLIACSFSSVKYAGRAPEGHVMLRAFFGGALDEAAVEMDDAKLIELAQHELGPLIGLSGEPVVAVVRRHWAMPDLSVGHVGRVDRIEQIVAQHDGLALAGNGYRGMGIPDCVRSGEAAAAALITV